MKKDIIFNIFLALIASGCCLIYSCTGKVDINEQENLNVVKLKIGSNTFIWSDTDGAGGVTPKIDTIRLTPNTTFAAEVTVQDGAANPVKDFTPEIIAEKDDHLFIYKVTGANLTITDLSKDSKNRDFGQTVNLKTAAASLGSLQLILKHLPDKSAADPSKTGETDLDISFPVVIR